MLEFTLEELFQRRTDRGLLTFDAYRDLGGVEGALANRAEAVYADLDGQEKEVLPRLLRALVTFAQGAEEIFAARRMSFRGLASDPLRRAVLERFIHARLVITDTGDDGEPVITVAHEALIHHWPRFQQWLEEDQEFLKVRSRISDGARHWRSEGGLSELLLPDGKPVAEARDILATRRDELDLDSIDYIHSSLRRVEAVREYARAEEQKKLRRSQYLAAVLGLLAIAAGVGGYLGFTRQQDALAETRKVLARELAPHARRLVEQQPQLSLLLALEAFKQTRGLEDIHASETDSLLREILGHVSGEPLAGHADEVKVSAFSPSGDWLVSGANDGRVRLWRFDRQRHRELVSELRGHTDSITAVAFHPTGKWFASAGKDQQVRVWDVESGETIYRFEEHLNVVFDVAFSDDGKWLASASGDHDVRLWTMESTDQGQPTAVRLSGHHGMVLSLAFSPGSRWLASTGVDGGVRLWSLLTVTDGMKARSVAHHATPVRAIAFSH